MIPTQTKRRMAVMAKHGEPGWFFDRKICSGWVRLIPNDPVWSPDEIYRAVRVERNAGRRVPLPWSMIRCGMVVRRMANTSIELAVDHVDNDCCEFNAGRDGNNPRTIHAFLETEYLDYDNELKQAWKPLWTEEPGEEKIVEIVSEEEG